LLYRTQEEMGDLRDRLAEAEDKATGLAAELADAHRRHAMKIEQLNSLRNQALAALGLRREEIRQLTEEVKDLSRHIAWLEKVLREAWRAVGHHVDALGSAVDLVVDLAGRLVDTDDADSPVPPAQ
ncbi:coiled-coil domain-containing protein, partial [Streptomyces luteolifulvus]